MKRFNRHQLISGTAAAFSSIAFVRFRGEAAEFSYKCGNDLPAMHPMNVRAQAMVGAIKQESGGRIEIQLFPNNELGGDTAMITQVRSGALEFLLIPDTVLSTLVPVTAIDGVAFAFPSYKQVWAALDGDLGAYERNEIAKVDLHALAKLWNNGYREMTTSTRPIHGPEDLKGLKIRVPASSLVVSMFKGLGASPTPINANEMYAALQSHVVDAQENPLAVLESFHLYEVQKYVSLTNHMWNGYWFVVNGDAWKKLPKNLQEIVERNVNAAAEAERVDTEKLDATMRSKLESQGMVFNTVDPLAFRAALGKAGFYSEWSQKFGAAPWALLEKYTSRMG